MRTLEVSAAALPSAVQALDAFAAAVEPAGQPALPGDLGAALAEFHRTWARELTALAGDARAAGLAVEAAREQYAALERLLVPAALR